MNLKNAKIYKITGGGKTYIGSTTKSLNAMLSIHKCSYNKYLDGYFNYVTSFEVVKHDDCEIELIENFPCETIQELHERARYWIKSIECVNKNILNRTMKEYRQDNREKILEQMKEYKKQQVKCPCGSTVTKSHLARHYLSFKHQDWLCKQVSKPTKIKLTIKLKQT